MNITLTIPDAQAQRILNGFCADRGYQATLLDGTPNPETKAQFMKRRLIEYIKTSVRSSEMQSASEAATTAAAAKVESEITIS